MNNIGIYLIVESDLDNAALDRAVTHVQRTQPKDAIVMSGGQYDRAMQTCERIRAIAPKTRITYRHWPNDGALALFKYNAALLYSSHVKPLLSWLKQHNIRFHLDNESVTDDMHPYSDTTARCIELADADGIGLGVASFATGNPADKHYAQLDSMWKALAKSPLSFWCPHEYFNTTPQTSGGHIFRFMEAWKYCDKAGIKRPDTCIQEYGLLIGYDPEAGWRRSNWDGKRYADTSIDYFKTWYLPHGVSVCPYAFCGMGKNNKWRDCSTNDEKYLTTIEAYQQEPPIVTPPPPPLPPTLNIAPTDPRWAAYTALAVGAGGTIRIQPNTGAATVTVLDTGIATTVGHIPLGDLTAAERAYSFDGQRQWHAIRLVNQVGWIRQDVVTLTRIVEPPPPPPLPATVSIPAAFALSELKEIDMLIMAEESMLAVRLAALAADKARLAALRARREMFANALSAKVAA